MRQSNGFNNRVDLLRQSEENLDGAKINLVSANETDNGSRSDMYNFGTNSIKLTSGGRGGKFA